MLCALKPIRLILLLGISATTLSPCVWSQENSGARKAPTFITVLDSNREQDGLTGPVRRVRTETAKLSINSGKLIEGPRALLETTTYDPKGNRIDNAYYLVSTSHHTGREAYKYDNKGNITEMTLYDNNGSIVGKEAYTYELDAIGNWTKMVSSVAVLEAGKLSYEPIEVTYRTITYYFDGTIANINKSSSPTTAPAGSLTANPVEKQKPKVLYWPEGGAGLRSNITSNNQPVLPLAAGALNEPGQFKNLSGPAGTLTTDNKKGLGSSFVVKVDGEPPASLPKPTASLVSGGVANRKLITIPKPDYPEAAKRAGITGTVVVAVMIDPNGKVISTRVVSGHPLLQEAAVEAARQARFSPMLLSGRQAATSRVISFTFSNVQ